jgi:hypothetical protein
MSDIIFTPDSNFFERLNTVESTLSSMDAKIKKIYDVLVGDERFDQEGVIARLKKLENENERNKALKNKLVGAFVVGGASWTIIFEMIKTYLIK